MQVIQHPDATIELIEVGKIYEQKVPTLGAQFFNAVDEAVAVIAAAPERWRIVESYVRRFLIPRFPYAVYPTMQNSLVRGGISRSQMTGLLAPIGLSYLSCLITD